MAVNGRTSFTNEEVEIVESILKGGIERVKSAIRQNKGNTFGYCCHPPVSFFKYITLDLTTFTALLYPASEDIKSYVLERGVVLDTIAFGVISRQSVQKKFYDEILEILQHPNTTIELSAKGFESKLKKMPAKFQTAIKNLTERNEITRLKNELLAIDEHVDRYTKLIRDLEKYREKISGELSKVTGDDIVVNTRPKSAKPLDI